MSDKTQAEQYAELMKANSEGRFLYYPQRYTDLHPGSVGFFDRSGSWNEIADLSKPESLKEAKLTPFNRTLTMLEPREIMWKTKSSESEDEQSIRGTGGLSGAMSAAPVDVSSEGKYKKGSMKKAALVTGHLVKHQKYKPPFGHPIGDWIKTNGNTLAKGDWRKDIEKYGLWAIQETWVTPECAITMTSDSSRDFNLGLDVGATGFGKLGAGGSSLAKLKSEGWSTYEAKEGDKGLVVSFWGVYYRMRTFSKFFNNSILKEQPMEAGEEIILRAITDENGNVTGHEKVRPIRNDKGDIIDYQKVDREAERAKREEEKQKQEEEERKREELNQSSIEVQIDCEGMTEEDIQAEKEYQEERKKESMKRKEEISQIPDKKKQLEELVKLVKEDPDLYKGELLKLVKENPGLYTKATHELEPVQVETVQK
ncbi:hypothetical protein PHISCL_07712 [Aspergillus sclerotialis]|uniref:Uncharacterized protein n=1 Tax=Aspergillus sclerotialis TaxID=2070753 RepID=A0A3A2Z9Z4_9EURO|nr:hypothetical protein PHISCL_07712 [Aspergillus sclerotialis]